MTYNMLAQALARRSQFPNSRSALKWAYRSEALLSELDYYNPDIVCVQEVDEPKWESFWKPRLEQLGYGGIFYCHENKRHGLAILYKKALFSFQTLHCVDYDETPGLPNTITTGNIGLFVYLSFEPATPSYISRNDMSRNDDMPKKNGIIVGTTHAYWHPFGTYERCRQAHILLQEYQAFQQKLKKHFHDPAYYNFVAGDFNTDPEFPSYRFLTNTDFQDPQICRTVCRARDHDFSSSGSRDDIAPKEYDASEAAIQDFKQLSDWREANSIVAVSLYSMGYKYVHPRNVQEKYGEPQFSNWCDNFVALLDYIFVMSESPVRTVQDLDSCDIKLLELLRMPERCEMGLGLPQPRMYPSDHLCMIAKVELN